MRKTIKFNGFGFPVTFVNVPIKVEHGEELPAVNFSVIQDSLFQALLLKPNRLSGAEVKFLRHYLEFTQEAFAKVLKVERSLISKWESKDLKATGMSAHIEIFLRLKLAKIKNQNIERNFSVGEPAIETKSVGKPVELKFGKSA